MYCHIDYWNFSIVITVCILGKSYDLVEQKPADEFEKFKKQVKPVNTLVAEWRKRQACLQEKGLDKKQVQSLTTERRRNGDLQKLKCYGGPMTKPEEVDKLVEDVDTSEAEKLDRLYLEVRYARDTTLSLPKSSPLFRLKDKYKKLPLETYQKNLKVYLSKVSCAASTTWEDFDDAISRLQAAMI